MLTVTHLRTEYLKNPLSIDTQRPRFSWIAQGSGRGQHLSAYQVLAATSQEALENCQGDLWDSGKVESRTLPVEYGGQAALYSGQRVWWKVRAWDSFGEVGPYSAPAWFEMGLLSPQDWQAEWIGFPGAWPGRALYFRRDFQVEKTVRRARVYMAGLGWSELRVNGQRVNDRVLDPPQSDYAKYVYYTTDAVEDFLRLGHNTFSVVCGNGWFGTVRLLLQMHVEYTDGTIARVITQSSWAEPWLVATGPVQENSVYDGEVYDARLEQADWDSPETEANTWLPAAGADGPGGKLVPAALEPIRVIETLAPQTVGQPRPGIFVFDLGQNIAGWARLRVKGPRGSQVTLRYAETLYPDGTVNQENLRTASAEDVYILKGSGEEVWEPSFTYHGFRYIQVEGYPGEISLDSVQGRVVRSAVEPAGTFDCSSRLFNRIHQMVRWTEASNLHSLPTDCPQRDERMGWLNDMAARSEEALYNFNLARLFSKWTADIAGEQSPTSGAITDTAPFRWGRRPADPVSVCYLLIPWLLYVHYGDTHTLAERYSGMKQWVDFLTGQAHDGLLNYSYYGDWAPPVGLGVAGSLGDSAVSKTAPGPLVSTACYAYSARLLSWIAGALEQENARAGCAAKDYGSDAVHYAALADSIAECFNRCFWDEDAGVYATGSQSCNAIALYMDLVPAGRIARVVENLVADVLERHDGHLTTGNICTKYLLEALTAAGRADVAYTIAAQESYPGWGFMLANGATTLWERWELATGGGMNSHNHPMLGSVDSWLYRAVAGIQASPEGPGFECFDLRPNFGGGLTHARAVLQTLRGPISCAWKIDENAHMLECMVPVGSRARVFLPAPPGVVVREGERIIWEKELPAGRAAGLLHIDRQDSLLLCEVGSGAYQFHWTKPG